LDQPSTDLHGFAAPGSETETVALSFAGLRLEADGTLFRGETPLHLPPRELAALRLLLAHAGQIVTPAQVKQALWGDVHVTADSVPRLLSSLRAHLHPDNCIQTVYKRGYRLFAPVRSGDSKAAPALPRLAIPPFSIEAGVPIHLGTALAEETIARLSNAQSPQASVLARDSVFTLAQRGMTAQQIGESLHADMVLAGTLRCFTGHFRLRMEMIRVADGVQIWVEDLLVARHAVAGIESDLVNRIDFQLKSRPFVARALAAQNLQPAKSSSEKRGEGVPEWQLSAQCSSSDSEAGQSPRPALAETTNVNALNPSSMEAFETFLRGRHEWQSRERDRVQDGLQQLIPRRQT
jgi:DNA-binding winged helix-turn-helix (wHTH) protein